MSIETNITDFKKKNISKLLTVKSQIRAMGEIFHEFMVRCETCMEMSKDEDLKTITYAWRTQTENEAVLIKDLHLSENEGHLCGVNVG